MKNICLSLLFLISSPWKVTPCRPGTINERRLEDGSPWGGLRPLLVAEQRCQTPRPSALWVWRMAQGWFWRSQQAVLTAEEPSLSICPSIHPGTAPSRRLLWLPSGAEVTRAALHHQSPRWNDSLSTVIPFRFSHELLNWKHWSTLLCTVFDLFSFFSII